MKNELFSFIQIDFSEIKLMLLLFFSSIFYRKKNFIKAVSFAVIPLVIVLTWFL